jgi:DNA repair photolyase
MAGKAVKKVDKKITALSKMDSLTNKSNKGVKNEGVSERALSPIELNEPTLTVGETKKVDKKEKKPEVKIEYLPVDKLIMPKYNPRQISDHDMHQLKKSLTGFDAVQPAVVNMFKGREGIIVGGNQRVRAAKGLGWDTFPCVVVSLTEDKEKELNVRLNRNTGLFDNDLLVDNFSKEALKDFGFEDTELGDIFGDVTEGMDKIGDPTDEDDDTVETVDQNELETGAWCSLDYRADVGKSMCSHGCLYCFTKATPAGLQAKEGRFKLTKREVLKEYIVKASKAKQILSIGECNDPALPEFRERLMYVLNEATKLKCYLKINTKNPLVIVKALEETGASPALVTIRTAFSFCTDAASVVAEPGAPRWSLRLEGLKKAHAYGCDIMPCFFPFFLDYYDGFEATLDVLEGLADRWLVVPMRSSATGKHYFGRIAPLLTKDGKSLEKYVDRIKNQTRPMSGALHWYTYDQTLLRNAYITLKTWINARGAKFGICDGTFGAEHADLIEGEYGCQTNRMEAAGLSCSHTSMEYVLSHGRLNDIRVPLYVNHPDIIDNLAKLNASVYNLVWASHKDFDPRYLSTTPTDILPPASGIGVGGDVRMKAKSYAKSMRKK